LIVSILIRSLEAVFLVGLIGSAIVVVLTTIEDMKVLVSREAHEVERPLPGERQKSEVAPAK
jgi:hypothetical protein